MDKKYKFIEENRNLCKEDIPEIKEWLKYNDINKKLTVYETPDKKRELTLIEIAANNKAIEVVDFLIKRGAVVYSCSEKHWNTLMEFSAAYDYLDTIKCLLKNGYDRETFLKDNSLIIAAVNNFPDIIKFLIEQGKDIDQADSCGFNALRMGAQENSVECVKLLCELGANVDPQTECDTPLYSATAEGNLEVVKILIKYGANVNYKNEFGTTPLRIAKTYKHKNIAEYLLAHGAKIN